MNARMRAGEFSCPNLNPSSSNKVSKSEPNSCRPESMNMRMSKLLDTIGPLPAPIVQTTTAVMPPPTEVKITAPLSAFASASASKPTVPNQDLWEMLEGDGNAPIDAYDPVTEIHRS